MESILLSVLRFRVTSPTAYTFLSLLRGALALPPRAFATAEYLLVRKGSAK